MRRVMDSFGASGRLRLPRIGDRVLIGAVIGALLFCPARGTAQNRPIWSGPGMFHDGDTGSGSDGDRSSMLGSGLPYHNGPTLYCTDCHVMHLSMQHNYAGGTGPEGGEHSFPATFGESSKLLNRQDPLDVCLACHDGQVGVPDVVGIDVNGLSERSAGFFADPEVPNLRGHDLGRGLPPVPTNYCDRCHTSNPVKKQVTCIDCHNPHGNGHARNLQWASASPEQARPLGLFTPPGLSFPAKYERANVAYGTDNTLNLREVTSLCIDCHHVFSGPFFTDPDGNGIHNRHPCYDSKRHDQVVIAQGAARGTTNPSHWEGGRGPGFDGTIRVPFVTSGATNYAAATHVSAASNGVFCLSCHKAHGSSSAFGLVWRVTDNVNAVGCDQCHGKTLP